MTRHQAMLKVIKTRKLLEDNTILPWSVQMQLIADIDKQDLKNSCLKNAQSNPKYKNFWEDLANDLCKK